MTDPEETIAKEIEDTRIQLDAARNVVRDLANDLASVADVIEPVLADHANRIRRARMMTLDEVRITVTSLKELRDFLLSPQTEKALAYGDRLVALYKELEEFRACGFLDAYLYAIDHVR